MAILKGVLAIPVSKRLQLLGLMDLIIVECEDINAWRVDETDLKVIHTVKKF